MPRVLTDIEKVDLYRSRIKKAQNQANKWHPDAKRRVERYENKASEEDFTQKGNRVSVPTGVAVIDSMFSSMTAVDIRPAINLKGRGDPDLARVAEQNVLHTWEETKVPRKTAYALKDGLIVGIGWVKVGYDYAEHDEVQPKSEDEARGEMREAFNASVQTGTVPEPEALVEAFNPLKEVTVVDRDRIVVDYVPWENLFWDHTAKKVEDIRWIASVTKRHIDDVIDDERYREYARARGNLKKLENLKPDSKVAAEILPDGHEPDEDDDRITEVEYIDLVTGTVCTFAMEEDWLLYETVNPFHFNEDMEDRNPYVPIVLRSNPDNIRGISDMELIEPTLQELMRTRGALLNYLERFVPKVLAKKGVFGDTGKADLMSPDPAIVETEDDIQLGDVQELKTPQLPQESFAMAERIEQSIFDATGANEVTRGMFPDRKRTATETTEVVSASAARQSEKRSLLEEFFTNIARRILQLAQTYYDTARVIRVSDLEQDIEWEWDAESITSEMDLRIEIAPKQYLGPAEREERAMKLANFISPMPNADQEGLQVQVLKEWGFTMQEIRKMVKLSDEQQVEKQQALQDQANAAVAAEGEVPDPASVPGPLGAEELAAAANPGEIPPEVAAGQPPQVEQALELLGDSTRPGSYVPGV